MQGEHAAPDQLPQPLRSAPFSFRSKQRNMPLELPGWILNSYSIKVFNVLFYHFNGMKSSFVQPYEPYFFPLDSIHNWNRMYGKRGFAQYQATFPFESKQGLISLLETLSESRRGSFLAIVKRFGPAGKGLLSHPMSGFTLTLDLPNRRGLSAFMRELDEILLDYGGRLYTAKDCTADPATFSAMYPQLDAFLEVKAQVDPFNCFASTMSRRLGLTPTSR